ncbi:MAG: hypothetical protein LAO31_02100 [Acidobacteriia bacterium]|nr:hypothetical protein [Terriglobia bacterium]
MPIEYQIDRDRKLVLAKARGTVTDEDVFGYQREVWSRDDVAGYDELVDMSEVEHIAVPSVDRVRQLASLSVNMDAPSLASKLAIIAPQDVAFGLGRMYATYRGMDPQSKKQVEVFRSLGEALAFLGVTGLEPFRGDA